MVPILNVGGQGFELSPTIGCQMHGIWYKNVIDMILIYMV